nr:hypothetical protein [Propionispora sp. 2/2-37]
MSDFVTDKENFGRFIQDQCKNALSHIHRTDPNKTSILPFRAGDFEKILYAKAIMLELAYKFIKEEIGIPEDKPINTYLIE